MSGRSICRYGPDAGCFRLVLRRLRRMDFQHRLNPEPQDIVGISSGHRGNAVDRRGGVHRLLAGALTVTSSAALYESHKRNL